MINKKDRNIQGFIPKNEIINLISFLKQKKFIDTKFINRGTIDNDEIVDIIANNEQINNDQAMNFARLINDAIIDHKSTNINIISDDIYQKQFPDIIDIDDYSINNDTDKSMYDTGIEIALSSNEYHFANLGYYLFDDSIIDDLSCEIVDYFKNDYNEVLDSLVDPNSKKSGYAIADNPYYYFNDEEYDQAKDILLNEELSNSDLSSFITYYLIDNEFHNLKNSNLNAFKKVFSIEIDDGDFYVSLDLSDYPNIKLSNVIPEITKHITNLFDVIDENKTDLQVLNLEK